MWVRRSHQSHPEGDPSSGGWPRPLDTAPVHADRGAHHACGVSRAGAVREPCGGIVSTETGLMMMGAPEKRRGYDVAVIGGGVGGRTPPYRFAQRGVPG